LRIKPAEPKVLVLSRGVKDTGPIVFPTFKMSDLNVFHCPHCNAEYRHYDTEYLSIHTCGRCGKSFEIKHCSILKVEEVNYATQKGNR